MTRKVEINIEELVLHGFAPGDRYDIAQSLELELTRLFTENGIPSNFSENQNIDRLNAGSFNTTAGIKSESIGIQAAKSVFKGLKS